MPPNDWCCLEQTALWKAPRMIDAFAKDYLHSDLRDIRATMLGKLDGLTEYDVRRPLTATGTNLLGLVKHLSIYEAWYFGSVFGRPAPEELTNRGDEPGADMWAAADESVDDIVGRYRKACEHADATISELAIDAPGHVPWWPRPDVMLFNVMVHRLTETNRHAGHADILREQLDSANGVNAAGHDEVDWTGRCRRIEEAARRAAG